MSKSDKQERQGWGGKAALNRLVKAISSEKSTQAKSVDAQTLSELAALYDHFKRALASNALDLAIELGTQIEERSPGYRDVPQLLPLVISRRIEELKDQTLLAIDRGQVEQALALLDQIKSIDPDHEFCSQQELAEIKERLPQERRWRWYALGALGVIVMLLVLGLLLTQLFGGSGDNGKKSQSTAAAAAVTPTKVMAVTTMTSTPKPTSTPRPSPTLRPPATATRRAIASPTPPPAPAVDALVLEDGAELRPGASTWWYPRETLPADAELELIGYDTDHPDWVYVRATDSGSEGWTQLENLQVHRELAKLPKITPLPTLTPTPAIQTPIVPECEGGPLWFDVWPIDSLCLMSGGWETTIFVEGHGGNCLYTYSWQGEVRAGPMPGSTTFIVVGADTNLAIVGTASVTSGGETVYHDLYVDVPNCNP